MLIVSEDLFKRGARQSITDAAGEIAEIEAFAGWIGRAEETLQSSAQILRANQKRFGVFREGFDQADGGARGKSGEEIVIARGVEVLAAVEFEHEDRI